MAAHPWLLALAACVLSACGHNDPNAIETPTEKTEWSILQGAEFRGRSMHFSSPTVQVIDGYELLVIPEDGKSNIWIMLNPKAPPYYKQMPASLPSIKKEYVDQLVRTHDIGYTTATVLNNMASQQ